MAGGGVEVAGKLQGKAAGEGKEYCVERCMHNAVESMG